MAADLFKHLDVEIRDTGCPARTEILGIVIGLMVVMAGLVIADTVLP
jgi:hypothetical protein